jgi:hypothetical protein
MNRKRRVGAFGARENYPKVDERESQRERWILESRVEATDACAFDILHDREVNQALRARLMPACYIISFHSPA